MSVDNKSNYYDAGGIESIETIKAKLRPEQFVGYLLGNILKYSQRANFKGSFDRDSEKIAIYSIMLNDFNEKHRDVLTFRGEHTFETCQRVMATKDEFDAMARFDTARDVESFYYLYVWREPEGAA